MRTVLWDHIFPNNQLKTVVLTINQEEQDLKKSLIDVKYQNGTLLKRIDYEDLVESLEQNFDIFGSTIMT